MNVHQPLFYYCERGDIMLKEWIVNEATAEGAALARELAIAPIIGQILWNRGIC